MAVENLKIKQRTEDAIKYGYIALRQFPKSEKFSLAQDIKKTMFAMLEQIIRANRSRDKRAMLETKARFRTTGRQPGAGRQRKERPVQ